MFRSIVAVVTDCAANDGPVLLLDVGIVVLLARSAAVSGANELPDLDIRVINPHTATMAQGFLALAASEAIGKGARAEETQHTVLDLIPRVHLFITLDTLEYLRKGGRIGGARGLLGAALNIKPLLHVPTHESAMRPLSQVRSRRKAIYELVEQAVKVIGERPAQVAIQHSEATAEDVNLLTSIVTDRPNCRELYHCGVSPLVGTHLGPVTLALSFYAEGD